MAKKWAVQGSSGTVEIEAFDIEEAIQKYKQLNSNADIEAVQKTSDW